VALQISVRQYNDVIIVDLSGKSTIDASESELLSKRLRALTDYGKRKVLLNLANLTKMDSTGISAIVESYLCVKHQKGALKLLSPRGRVLEVLTLFRLLETIPSFEDETQALASFRWPAEPTPTTNHIPPSAPPSPSNSQNTGTGRPDGFAWCCTLFGHI